MTFAFVTFDNFRFSLHLPLTRAAVRCLTILRTDRWQVVRGESEERPRPVFAGVQQLAAAGVDDAEHTAR